MGFTLTQVEQMAPDQASLTAASKLAKAAKWLSLAHEGDLWWGECQGSGANPYRAIVDSGVVGYKCTCPSRKFPCKHDLALMWIVAQAPGDFVDGTTPQWVTDWMGRRRTTTSTDEKKTASNKSISLAEAAEAPPEPEDPAAAEKKVAAARKRQEDTKAAIAEGLDDLDQWISDQLATGLMAFIDHAADRCRRIAARLVDRKAAAMASRLDEMPSRLLSLPTEERPDAAVRELGKLVLLGKAWRRNPDDPQAARDVGTAEKRDDVLADPAAVRVAGRWEVAGEQIRTRRDGLVSHSTWFLRVGADPAQFALLLDFYPASAGRRESSFAPGAQYDATMVFYASDAPLRAIALDLAPATDDPGWPVCDDTDPLNQVVTSLDAQPWRLEHPLLLPAGRVVAAGSDLWWRADSGAGLPVAGGTLGAVSPQIMGVPLTQSIGVWDGARLALLSSTTPLGKVSFT